ncbi:hypothetical protein [Selenomonas ruminantium]|uniref:hypothetical protein n=1 Tax=Selenomonas ruminantium TaxID=971 RepID=UPI0026EF0C9C|nr:hypothetical protein [Selenomonas ruminantium]
MRKLGIFLWICVLALGLCLGGKTAWDFLNGTVGATGPATVSVHSLGQPAPETIRDIEQAAAAFPQLLEERYQVSLQQSVDIWVSADTVKYEELLVKRLGVEEDKVKPKAQYTSGESVGRKNIIALDGDKQKMTDKSERYSTTGHELFHQLQYELSEGRSGYENSLFWLEEGTADYAGALLAEKMGGRSVEKWYMDDLFTLQNAREAAKVEKLQRTTEEERMQLLSGKAKYYTLSDVMVYYLLHKYGGDRPEQKIIAYYKGLAKGEAETVFAQAFGVELNAFLQEFSAWWQGELSAPAQLEAVVRPQVDKSVARQFQKNIAASRQWLQRHWGHDLKGRYKLVLVNGVEDYAAAMEEYCGVNAEEAKKTAADSVWAENNSTLFVNAAKIEDSRQSAFVSSTMVSRLFILQQLGNEDTDMSWLLRGISYVAGVSRLVETGEGRLPDYQRAWRLELRKNTPLPTVDKIMTADDMARAMEQYGNESVSHLCEYAAAELVRRYGWAALYNWQLAARRTGEGKQAFSQVFGITAADFAAQVYLMIYG